MPPSRPLILLGHGIRAAGAAHLVPRLVALGVPIASSWQAKDLIDHDEPLFMGCPGIYGNRAANLALYHADEIIAIGNRLAIWNVGYEGLRPDQGLGIVTLDHHDASRYPHAEVIHKDCKEFIENISGMDGQGDVQPWLEQCAAWKDAHPWVEPGTHDDPPGAINSYRFFDALSSYLKPDAQITIDCGAACSSAFQTLRVNPPQRIYSSGGLGEMGCALPAAIGVSFARDKGEVLCIVGDGALMLNLQELQTIVHHDLPVKVIVCRNDGYMMIKRTQENAMMALAGVGEATGVSCPRFQQLAFAFGMHAASVHSWDDFRRAVPSLLAHKGPALLEYHMHPEQVIAPKLGYSTQDGNPRYDKFSDMRPHLQPQSRISQ